MITTPARGTRPRNRRELLRAAAADLFAEHGYANVAMADVAAAVNVGTSAVYHHYVGKAELLFDVIDGALERAASGLPADPAGELPEVARILAALILDDRALGVLWQREAANLGRAERARLGKRFMYINTWLATALEARRPELPAAEAELLAIGLAGMSHVTARYWTQAGRPIPRDAAATLVAHLSWRGIGGFPKAEGRGEPRAEGRAQGLAGQA